MRAGKENELKSLLTLLKSQNPDISAKKAEITAISLVMGKIEDGDLQLNNKEELALLLFKSEVQLDEMKTLLKSTNPDVIAKQNEINSFRIVLKMLI